MHQRPIHLTAKFTDCLLLHEFPVFFRYVQEIAIDCALQFQEHSPSDTFPFFGFIRIERNKHFNSIERKTIETKLLDNRNA